MKRFIKQDVFAMSYVKSTAEKLIIGQSDVIEEHTAKLVLYSSLRPNDVNGWKRSICRSFRDISSIKVKPKNKKFDTQHYIDMVLPAFGEDSRDISIFLDCWELKLTSGNNPYEDTDVTDGMITLCESIVDLYVEFCKEISNSKDEVPYEYFKSKLDAVIIL